MSLSELKLSLEQEAIASQGGGFIIGVANAGSGKTFTAVETIVRCFRRSLIEQYGSDKNCSPSQISAVLDQFCLITFTKKAAASLDERIKKRLASAGFEVPLDRWNKERRMCWTLDAYIKSKLTHPMFFKAWAELKHTPLGKVFELFELAPQDIKDSLSRNRDGSVCSGADQLRKFYIRIPTLVTGVEQRMIADIAYRTLHQFKLPAKLSPGVMADDLRSAVGALSIGEEKWLSQLWAGWVELWSDDVAPLDELIRNLHRHKAATLQHELPDLIQRANQWKKVSGTVNRFMALYSIAKTRRYNALANPGYLGSQAFLEAFASSNECATEDVASFHQWAVEYETLKRTLCVRDFSDGLEAIYGVLKCKPFLREGFDVTPKHGFRFRYTIWDEAQDFTPRQFELVKMMHGKPESKALTLMIGDGKQSIYQFAGSSPFEFTKLIRETKDSEFGKVFTLSQSFRSTQEIVGIGNEISTTLPSYAQSVIPSTTVIDAKGEIDIAPPLANDTDEAKWIMDRIDRLLLAGESDIMVLFRSGIEAHPITSILRDPKYGNVQLMTIHKSKGLEARYVFVGGCTAGRFPDAIGDTIGRNFEEAKLLAELGTKGDTERLSRFNDQEVNLFYVAATRAVISCTFSCPKSVLLQTEDGPVFEARGISPFIAETPSLRALAITRGWTEIDMLAGAATHSRRLGQFYGVFCKRFTDLVVDAKQGGFTPSTQVEDTSQREDTARLGLDELLRKKGDKRSLLKQGVSTVSVIDPERVKKKLKDAFFQAKTPTLNSAEKDCAFREGWVSSSATGAISITPKFKLFFRPA